jgi:hypothetical protein
MGADEYASTRVNHHSSLAASSLMKVDDYLSLALSFHFGRADELWSKKSMCGPAAFAFRYLSGLLKGYRSRPHFWRNYIVHLLASKMGLSLTYRLIYDQLNYEGFVAGSEVEGYRANVRSAIKRIRKKFYDVDQTFDKTENYAAFGYCWKKTEIHCGRRHRFSERLVSTEG